VLSPLCFSHFLLGDLFSEVCCSFTERLDQIQRRHLTVVETMAQGLMEMKQAAAAKHSSLYDVEGRIQYFLDRFYLMRISIRLLIHQHCESTDSSSPVCVDTVRVVAFIKLCAHARLPQTNSILSAVCAKFSLNEILGEVWQSFG